MLDCLKKMENVSSKEFNLFQRIICLVFFKFFKPNSASELNNTKI